MKRMAFLLTVFLVFGAFSAWAGEGQERTDEVGVLREQIKALKEENVKLAKQVRQLQELCRKAGIALPKPTTGTGPASPEAPKAETYMYLGKPRSKLWFEGMYREFKDKVACVDGEYVDVGKLGEMLTEGKVLQVIDKEQLLIYPFGSREPVHVKGVDTKGLVDGAHVRAKLICVGTYRYTAVIGGIKTIQSYTVYTSLTKEQFAEALASGFKLVRYKEVGHVTREGNKIVTSIREIPVQ